MNSQLIKAAEFYAEHIGRAVLALKPKSKTPLTSHGLLDATMDLKILRNWWGKCPEANLGVQTGAETQLGILDVDPRHGGDVSLQALEDKFGTLPETVEVLTGGGGRHLYFKHPGSSIRIKSRTNALGLGLDIKADGGTSWLLQASTLVGKNIAGKKAARPGKCISRPGRIGF